MAEQCIVCLESLDGLESPQQSPSASDASGLPVRLAAPAAAATAAAPAAVRPAAAQSSTTISTASSGDANGADEQQENHAHIHEHDHIAVIQVCGHTLHDTCLREWSGKANSCPICRQSFHLVHVYDKVGGNLLSTYKVEDKKQVAEFDPQAWLDENPEEEEEPTLCPVCNLADQEELLLLCDGCDTPYHTYCIGLEEVPHSSWLCIECADLLGADVQAPIPRSSAHGRGRRRNDFFPRTQASVRRARQRARSDEWQGAWGQITGRIWDALSLDLDHDGDEALEEYRRSRRLRESEQREFQRWQQRLNIARRLGAQDVFSRNIPSAIIEHANQQSRPAAPARASAAAQNDWEEERAWGALQRAREAEAAGPSSRKRKSRSITSSPIEPPAEPERRLKRPRTRRIGTQHEVSPSKSSSAPPNRSEHSHAVASASTAQSPRPNNEEHLSFLSALLKEVETSTPSDDETIRSLFGEGKREMGPSSPGSSPSASAYNSPRALSTTPPPHRALRPSSPTLLSSHIEPIYPPANYSPTKAASENAIAHAAHAANAAATAATNGESSEHRPAHGTGPSELRQPRPRRKQPIALPRSQDASPTRNPLSLEVKENISSIVRTALKPHWKSSQLTADQYATINRDVSRKLYEEVTDPTVVDDDDARKLWEQKAAREVARAMAEIKA